MLGNYFLLTFLKACPWLEQGEIERDYISPLLVIPHPDAGSIKMTCHPDPDTNRENGSRGEGDPSFNFLLTFLKGEKKRDYVSPPCHPAPRCGIH